MKQTILILFLVVTQTLFAQPLLKVLPAYECVDYSKNILHFPASNAPMQNFYAHLDTLLLFGKGNINILHIGGSHVQADFFTHRIRTNLAQFHPNVQAQRGIIFPHNIAKMNASRNYVINYKGEWITNRNSRKPWDLRLGLTGVAAQTFDNTAEISFGLNKADEVLKWEFNRLRIMGYASDNLVQPIFVTETDTIFPVYDSISTTYLFYLPEMTDTAIIRFDIPTSEQWFVLTGIIPENDLQGINYFSVGINGASVPAWLRCVDFECDLRLVMPDVVVFGIGINDAAVPYGEFNTELFKQNYRSLIERIQRVSPTATFIFITNNDSYRSLSRKRMLYNSNGALAQKAFYDLAIEYNAAVWDVYDFMGGKGSVEKWHFSGLVQNDKLHFTRVGYELLGDMLYNAIISDYLKY